MIEVAEDGGDWWQSKNEYERLEDEDWWRRISGLRNLALRIEVLVIWGFLRTDFTVPVRARKTKRQDRKGKVTG